MSTRALFASGQMRGKHLCLRAHVVHENLWWRCDRPANHAEQDSKGHHDSQFQAWWQDEPALEPIIRNPSSPLGRHLLDVAMSVNRVTFGGDA